MAVRLSGLSTGLRLIPRTNSAIHISHIPSHTQGDSLAGRIRTIDKSYDVIGDLTSIAQYIDLCLHRDRLQYSVRASASKNRFGNFSVLDVLDDVRC